MPLSTGKVLNNRYRIVTLLGQGGFGAVYRVYDLNLERVCALKENLDTSQGAQRQFKREAKMLADLSHPNLPRVTDHFILAEQGQYLVMDYIEGEDLEKMMLRLGEPLALGNALDWIGQVCDALAYLHQQDPPIIHRDIKPANIKVTPQGKAVLVDFGISKVYDQGLATTVGARAVTAGFSPQEQYGQGTTDGRSDIYALGATLYAILTGEYPPESIQRNLGIRLTAPHEINPAVPLPVSQAILHAMEMLPEGRFQRIEEFKAALLSPAAERPIPETVQVQQPVAATVQVQQPSPESAQLQLGQTQVVVSEPMDMQPATPSRPAPAQGKALPWLWIGLAGVALVVLVALGALLFSGKDDGAVVTDEPLVIVVTATETEVLVAEILASQTSPPAATKTTRPTSTSRPAPTKTPTPALEAVYITPYCDNSDKVYEILSGQPVIIRWGWEAQTRQQVQDHIDAAVYQIYLDGKLLGNFQIEEIAHKSDTDTYYVRWYVEVGALSPGSHLTEYKLSWTKEISDGWDTYGPQTNPSISTCHFTVE